MGLFKTDEAENELRVGDRIRLKGTDREGIITGKEEGKFMVLMNDEFMISTYGEEELEKIW